MIESVEWDVERNSFLCSFEDQFCGLGLDDAMFDEWVEYFEEDGWLFSKPHFIDEDLRLEFG